MENRAKKIIDFLDKEDVTIDELVKLIVCRLKIEGKGHYLRTLDVDSVIYEVYIQRLQKPSVYN